MLASTLFMLASSTLSMLPSTLFMLVSLALSKPVNNQDVRFNACSLQSVRFLELGIREENGGLYTNLVRRRNVNVFFSRKTKKF